MKGRVVVEVYGGVVQDHTLINCAVDVEVLDWDNFNGAPMETWNEWPKWLQEHFREVYPKEYQAHINPEAPLPTIEAVCTHCHEINLLWATDNITERPCDDCGLSGHLMLISEYNKLPVS